MSVPKLRFKKDDGSALPAWMEHSLGDIFSERVERSNGTEELLAVTIANGVTKQSESARRNVAADDTSNYKVVHINDLAYNTMRMWQGAEGVSDYDGIISPAYTVVICNDNNLAKFFEIMFKRTPMLQKFERYSQGLTSDTWNLKYKNFSKIKTFIPSLREQQKIVELFSSIDKVIHHGQSEVDAWEKYKRGIMQLLFSQKVRFKTDDGSEYPKWEEKTLGELGEFFKGAPLSKADISEKGLPIILYGELYTTYGEVTNDIKNHTKADVSDRYLSKTSDVVIPTSGETPEEISTATCVMKDNVVLAGDLYIYRTSNALDGRLMSYLLNHQINNDIARIAQGKSIVHVHAKELCKLVVQYPSSISEQQKIVDCLSAFDEVINKAKQKLEAYKRLKEGLLQHMFV